MGSFRIIWHPKTQIIKSLLSILFDQGYVVFWIFFFLRWLESLNPKLDPNLLLWKRQIIFFKRIFKETISYPRTNIFGNSTSTPLASMLYFPFNVWWNATTHTFILKKSCKFFSWRSFKLVLGIFLSQKINTHLPYSSIFYLIFLIFPIKSTQITMIQLLNFTFENHNGKLLFHIYW